MRLLILTLILFSCATSKKALPEKNIERSYGPEMSSKSINDKKNPQKCETTQNYSYYEYLNLTEKDKSNVYKKMCICLLKKNQPQQALYFYNKSNVYDQEVYFAILLRLKRSDLLFSKLVKTDTKIKNISSLYFFSFDDVEFRNDFYKGWKLLLNGKVKEASLIINRLGNSKQNLYLKLYASYLSKSKDFLKIAKYIRSQGVSQEESLYLKSLRAEVSKW